MGSPDPTTASGDLRFRVLVSAYACEPGRGSEPGIGWNVVRELADEFDVTVLTRANNRRSIESADWEGHHRPSFVYHDLPAWVRIWKRGSWGTELYYLLWQASLRRVIREVIGQARFDVAHHITFGRYWTASPLSELGIPFVLGPVGGADSVPPSLRPALGLRGQLLNLVREAVRFAAERRGPVSRTIRSSRIAVGATPATADRLRALGAPNVCVEPAVGLPDEEVAALAARDGDLPPEPVFVCAGRLVAWKGYSLALCAFADALRELPGARLILIGDGPERRRLERLAAKLGVADDVQFRGTCPRPDTLALIGSATALLHPSLHDSGGWVCLEAMAMSRPVICMDLAGPAVLVPPEAGILVAAGNCPSVVAALASAMTRVAVDPDFARRLGASGRDHARRNYRWSVRGEVIRSLVRQAIG